MSSIGGSQALQINFSLPDLVVNEFTKLFGSDVNLFVDDFPTVALLGELQIVQYVDDSIDFLDVHFELLHVLIEISSVQH